MPVLSEMKEPSDLGRDAIGDERPVLLRNPWDWIISTIVRIGGGHLLSIPRIEQSGMAPSKRHPFSPIKRL